MARPALIAGAALAVAALSAPLAAQAKPSPADAAATAACDSTFARVRADSAVIDLTAYVQRLDGGDLPDDVADQILGAISTQLDLPIPLRLPVLGPGPAHLRAFSVLRRGDSTSLRAPVLNGVYGFTLGRDRTVSEVKVRLAALAPGIDSTVLEAIRGASAIGAFPRADGRYELRIAAGVPGYGRSHRIASAVVWRLPVRDAVAPRELPAAVYPAEERDEEWEGNVVLQFVVDRAGEPRMDTVELLRSTSPNFARAAIAILPKLRYAPAQVAGCAVWQLVRLDVPFTLPAR